MISLNEIPWESITLPIFKYWYNLFLFEKMLYIIIKGDKSYENLIKVFLPVNHKVFRFFFKGLKHFKNMNIKIVDTNINAQKSESSVVTYREKMLNLFIERIKNCETIQDLIDSSPTAECPVCMDVTFTESTDFLIRVGCNHLVCLSCSDQLVKYNNMLVKNILFFFLLISWIFLFKTFSNVDPFLLNSG